MGIEDIIIIAVLVILLGGALLYIRRAKKRGQKCIGCSNAGNCPHSCNKK